MLFSISCDGIVTVSLRKSTGSTDDETEKDLLPTGTSPLLGMRLTPEHICFNTACRPSDAAILKLFAFEYGLKRFEASITVSDKEVIDHVDLENE